MTPDRTIESLYEELVQEGIIVRCPKVRLSDYEGEYSHLATVLLQDGIEPMPNAADVRRLITEVCILPLGSQVVHEKAPHTKSVALVGPHGVGKKLLVHAICTETGANLFDLTPGNIADKYPGKSGLNMLLHMVFKVAKAWQPSVVFIEECEKTFMKKIPKTDKTDPKRVKKALPKILKGLKPEDRVMIIGATCRPFDAEAKAFCGMYQRIIMLPRPEYGSRLILWKSMLTNYGGLITDSLDLSSLARVTDGYTQGDIHTAVTTVLTEKRIQQLRRKPLIAAEFIPPLSKLDPVFEEEEKALKEWYGKKAPLGKLRTAELNKALEDTEDPKAKKKGKGKKK